MSNAIRCAVLGLPFVEDLRADAVFAAQLLRVRAGFGFFDDADDLCFREAGLSQGGFPFEALASGFLPRKTDYFNGHLSFPNTQRLRPAHRVA